MDYVETKHLAFKRKKRRIYKYSMLVSKFSFQHSPDQVPQYAASDPGLCWLHRIELSVKQDELNIKDTF